MYKRILKRTITVHLLVTLSSTRKNHYGATIGNSKPIQKGTITVHLLLTLTSTKKNHCSATIDTSKRILNGNHYNTSTGNTDLY